MDNYAAWIRIGMILQQLGAPISLWEDVSKRSKKYKLGDCTESWPSFHTQFFSIGSLFAQSKEGNLEMVERLMHTLNMINDAFAMQSIAIPSSMLVFTKVPGTEMTLDQEDT